MKLTDLIGKTVRAADDIWDGENEGESINITFTDGTKLSVYISAQPGGSSASMSVMIERE